MSITDEGIPDFDEVEWHRQMARTFSRPSSQAGRTLWLIVRRALFMAIAAFDAHYGVGKQKDRLT